MTADFTQSATEILQTVQAYHAERRSEMQAEIARLRTNILAMGDYAREQAAAEMCVTGRMTGYYLGRADVYAEMAMRADIAYGAAIKEDTADGKA
ncbi:hypothetical protein M6D81_11295 [Paenibacillus sp. J5C_2022]|uniref:hypothetical protein n=1 Tax=Paenibacillus sp. J5C2022 TaxID=2977129 RepID=UPI0021D30CF4|nr:hypothetical protein [Paenibacillus sp. J5C2022]MCU6709291.1 hypothetical protein [Paenibacillus sp. J5C2022]